MTIEIQELTDENRDWARTLLTERWGSTTIVTCGKLYLADTLAGFVATVKGELKGLIMYQVSEEECEIISMDSLYEGMGIGSALLNAVHAFALSMGCRRIWLITTNDNTVALRFYQKKGFRLVAVHCNAIDKSRKLKPEIPEKGFDGIPIRDEVELEIKT
ncbi:GNAT family N-acetyltransferase [Thermodesulfobacteriota bacterium]